MNRLICDAIAERRLIAFDYDGVTRVAEVHSHGFNQSKVEAIRAFQVGGGSRASNPSGWKFFLVSKMVGLRVLGRRAVANRPGQDEAAHDFVVIHCSTAQPVDASQRTAPGTTTG